MQPLVIDRKKLLGTGAIVAMLAVSIIAAILPTGNNTFAQTAVAIATSADPHNNSFFGQAIVEVRIQDPALAADSTQSLDVPVTVTAFGATHTVPVSETSGTSGTLLMYIKVDPDGDLSTTPTTEGPFVPASPPSPTFSNVIIGTTGTTAGTPYAPGVPVTAVDFIVGSVNEGGTITVSYGGASRSMTYGSTPAQISADRQEVSVGETLLVEIYDPDMNLDPTTANVVTERVPNELLEGAPDATPAARTFTETGPNTARFQTPLTVTALPEGVDSQTRQLAVNDFDTFVSGPVPEVRTGSAPAGTTSNTTYLVQMARGTILPLDDITYASELPVIVFDPHRNTDDESQQFAAGILEINGHFFNIKEHDIASSYWVPDYSQDRIRLTFNQPTDPERGILNITPGNDIRIVYDGGQFGPQSELLVQISNTEPLLEVSESSVEPNGNMALTLHDPDLNDVASVVESYTIAFPQGGTTSATVTIADTDVLSLEILVSGQTQTLVAGPYAVTFTETGPNTGIFTSSISLTGLADAIGDGFSFGNGDIVEVRITDELDPATIKPASSVTVTVTTGNGVLSDRPSSPIIHYPTHDSVVGGTFTAHGDMDTYVAAVSIYLDNNIVGNAVLLPGGGTWSMEVENIEDGIRTIHAVATDGEGNVSEPSQSVTFTVDSVRPTGLLFINSGVMYTNSTQVVLDIQCTSDNPASKCSHMRVSANGMPDAQTLLEEFNSSKIVELPVGDGEKTIYLFIQDSAGNESSLIRASIILDQTAPNAPTIVHPSSGTETSETSIEISGFADSHPEESLLEISVVDGSGMLLGQTMPDMEGGYWSVHTIDLEPGTHEIRAFATDGAGNRSPGSFPPLVVDILAEPPHTGISIEDVQPHSTNFYSISVSGTAQSIDPDAYVQVHWGDGAVSELEIQGNTWSAQYEYAASQVGPTQIVAHLVSSGADPVISQGRTIILPLLPTWAIAGTLAAAGAAAGLLLATKSGTLKSKPKPPAKNETPDQSPPNPSVRLEFRYGIENFKEINSNVLMHNSTPPASSMNGSERGGRELQERLESVLGSSVQDVKEFLRNVKEAASIAEFCASAGQDPDAFLSAVADEGFVKMMKAVSPFYGNLLIRDIRINSHFQGVASESDSSRYHESQQAVFDVTVEMEPIRPFVEAVLLVGEVRTKAISVVFQLDTSVAIKKAGLTLKEEGESELNLEDIEASIEVSIVKISATLLGSSLPLAIPDLHLDRKVSLSKKEFKLRDTIVVEKDLQAISTTKTGEVANVEASDPSKLGLKAIKCPRCNNFVETINFCPECGLNLDSHTAGLQ